MKDGLSVREIGRVVAQRRLDSIHSGGLGNFRAKVWPGRREVTENGNGREETAEVHALIKGRCVPFTRLSSEWWCA